MNSLAYPVSDCDYLWLTLSYVYTYEVPNPVATPVRIYTYSSRNGFGISYVILRTVVARGYSMFTNGRKVQFNRSCPLFMASFGKLRLSDQVQFIAWHGIQRRIIWIFCRESEVSG